MPPAVNNCVRISGKNLSRFVSVTSQLLPVFVVMSYIWGCTSSSSRYLAVRNHTADSLGITESEIPSIRISEDNPRIDRRSLLSYVMPLMGVPYVYNGSDSTGFDCSGFTSNIFENVFRKTLPRSTLQQYDDGEPVERNALQFGDLVFFAMEGDTPSHVGIYVGDGLFAHASVSLGVTVSLLDSNYYKKRYCGARRFIK